jgi:hypothetical protein
VYSMPRVPPEGTTQAQSVCGNKLKGMTTYECHDQKYKKQLADETIHPRSFCNRCYTAARQHTSLGSTLVVPFLWKEHTENECQVYVNNHVSQKFRNNTQVCHHFHSLQRPGRRKLTKKGRPAANGKKVVTNHILTLVTPTQRPRSHDLSHCPVTQESIKCQLCCGILHQPLQVGCGALLCATCITTWVQSSSSEAVLCPCCQDEKLKPDCIRPAPHAIVELLDNM